MSSATARQSSVWDAVTTASHLGEISAGDQDLPVRANIAAVLPWPGIRRGRTVAVQGSVSLLFALLADATAAGSWAAVVGLPDLGALAAAEDGVELSRLALVPRPGTNPAKVISTLLDGMDLVAIGTTSRLHDSVARQLSDRARHHGTVLLPCGPWPRADVTLRVSKARWHGVGHGHGVLRKREITVHAAGRGAASRPQSQVVVLPGRVDSTPSGDSGLSDTQWSDPVLLRGVGA